MKMKTSTIKPARKMYNFNRKSYMRSERRMLRHLDSYGRRRNRCSLFWTYRSKGYYGGYWVFEWGRLAFLIAVFTFLSLGVGVIILLL